MKGFDNIGNTCYLNAGLQLLIQNRDLCNIVLSFKDKSNILKIVAKLIEEYYNDKKCSINPIEIKKLVTSRNRIFNGFQQQDSSEFIIFFLDLLNSEINKIIPNKNLLDKIYELQITTSTKCKVLECLTVSTNNELSTMLMLEVNSECNTLDDCYRISKQKIKLEGDNKYYCEKCKKKRIASQKKEITKWPKNLIIFLRRFNQTGSRMSKFSQEIKVPIEWRHDYKLKGVVYHSGSLHGGHYVYAGLDNIKNGKWRLFNDSSVSELSNNALANIVNNGYIYYFTK